MDTIERVVEEELRELLNNEDAELHETEDRAVVALAIRRAYDRAGLMLAPPMTEEAMEDWAAILARVRAESGGHVTAE